MDESKLEEHKKAYMEILDAVSRNERLCIFSLDEMKFKYKCHLLGLHLKYLHGFNIDPKRIYSFEYHKFNDYVSVGMYGEKYRRTISWEDSGDQPDGELLLSIGFSTGAYIFGNYFDDDYPREFFDEFFAELKSYDPKYSDTANKILYYAMDNAGKIFNEFPEILKKYYEKNKEDIKQRKIKRIEADLAKLRNGD